MSTTRVLHALVVVRLILLNATYFFLPLYLADQGVSGWWIGVLLGTFAVTALLSAFQTGVLTDRVPIRHMATVGFLLMALFDWLLTFGFSAPLLLPVFLIGGLGNTILEISLVSYVLKTAEGEDSVRAFGSYTLMTGLGIGVGVLAGGQLLVALGYERVFAGSALALIGAAGLAQRLGDTRLVRASMATYAADLRSRVVLLVAAGYFLLSLHWGAEVTSLTPFLRQDLSLSEGGSGLYLGTAVLFLGAGGVVGGWALRRGFSVTRLALLAFFMSGAGHLIMPFGPVWFSWGVRAFHEAGDGLAMVTLFVVLHRAFPPERIGGLASFVTTATIVGRLIGALGFAPLGAAAGFAWPIMVSGVLVMAAALPLVPVLRRLSAGSSSVS